MESDVPNNADANTKLLAEYKDQSGLNLSQNKMLNLRNTSEIPDTAQNTNSKFEMILYLIIVTFLFLVLILIFYYIHYGEYKIEPLFEDNQIIKPIVDRRKYKIIKLENNLEVMLISDRNTSVCSAAMAVDAGSFKDSTIPGLAHYTEHAMFLGSQSYSKPSSFENHLNYYFGKSNAYTTEDKTVFYFEVGWQGFEKSMEMFSKMFEEPFFDESFLDLEIEAVNSEHEKNLNRDSWRENQLLKSLADHYSPYSNFATGNSSTLRSVKLKILIEKMKKIYNEYYLPNYMKLVVVSNQNMEQLQNTVAFYFSELKNTQEKELIRKINEHESEHENIKTNSKSEEVPPFNAEILGQIIWFEKLAGGQHIDIVFPMDEVLSNYELKPFDLISYHLRFSGEGSLINYLQKNKLATKLEADVVSSFKSFSIYGITLYLTEEGLGKINEIIQLVFKYINLIKAEGITRSAYDEMKNLKEIKFKFKEKSEQISEETAKIASNMLNYNQKDYYNLLYIDYIQGDFNETAIKEKIKKINPENSLIIIGSTSFPANRLNNLIEKESEDRIEKWYGTKYKVNKIPSEYINLLESNIVTGQTFKLRSTNEYITNEKSIVSCYGIGVVESYKNGTLQEKCQEEFLDLSPNLVVDSANLKIWYKLDRSYLAPKVNTYLQFLSHFFKESPKEYLYMTMYHNYIKSHIDSILSDAKESGNIINIEFNEDGLLIFISSFTDLTERIIENIINIMFSQTIDENDYKEMVNITKTEMESHRKDQPYEKGIQTFFKMIKNNISLYQEVAGFTVSANYSEFLSVVEEMKNSFYIVSEFYGYIKIETIRKIELLFKPHLNQNKVLIAKSLNLTDDSVLAYFHSHEEIDGAYIYRSLNDLNSELNNVVINFYQIGPRDIKNSLLMDILTLAWDNMFYFNLRTVKQLGYVVSSQKYMKDNYMYFVFLLQGSKSIPNKMNTDIDEVIMLVNERLNRLEDDQVAELKENLAIQLLKPNSNLKESSDEVWHEVINGSLEFNRKFELFDELKNIKKEDIINFFRDVFYENVHKLSIQIFSHINVEDAVQLIIKREENYNLNSLIKSKVTNDLKNFK